MPDYRYLRAFLMTARLGGFSKAARELRIAQSAVSRQIKLLEEDLDKQLLVRSPGQILLTPFGEDLYRSLSDFDRTLTTLAQQGAPSEIRVGTLHGVLETWLVSLMAHLPEKPRLHIEIESDRPDRLLARLQNREFDLILTNDHPETELLSSSFAFREQLVLISSETIDLDKIDEQTWISYAKDDWLYRVFPEVEPRRWIRVNSMTAIVSFVRKGVGIAIVPTHLLGEDRDLHRLDIPLGQHPAIYLVTLNYRDRVPEPLRSVMQWIQTTAKSAKNP